MSGEGHLSLPVYVALAVAAVVDRRTADFVGSSGVRLLSPGRLKSPPIHPSIVDSIDTRRGAHGQITRRRRRRLIRAMIRRRLAVLVSCVAVVRAAAALGRGTSHGIARYLARALRSAFPAGASLTPSTASSAMENTATTCDRRCANLNLSRRQHLRNAPAVWNSLPKTVLSSDSVAVYKSRLKAFLFPRLSLLSLLTNALPGPSAS